MDILKKTFGTCFFQHIETYSNEEEALNGKNGTFKEIKISNLRIERTNIIKKENDEQRHQNSDKVEG